MKTIKLWLAFIMILSFISCTKDTTNNNNNNRNVQDFLVKDNEISGWKFYGTGWTANNISELTNFIDGLAELYQKYGFVEASSQAYSGKVNNSDAEIKITVYGQDSKNNALGVYNDPDNGLSSATELIPPVGDIAKYVRNAGLSQVFAFVKDKYYVQIEINADSEECLNVVKQFALNVSNKIKI